MTVARFKRLPVFPLLAVLMSILLISCQVLNCCRLNESISESLQHALLSWGVLQAPDAKTASAAAPSTHPNCHGHGSETGNVSEAMAAQPGDPEQTGYAARKACLSEQTVQVNGQPTDSVSQIKLPPQIRIGFVDASLRLPSRVEKQRPQNRSSPPVYLLTLRILV